MGRDSLVANGPNGDYYFRGENVGEVQGKKKGGGYRPCHGHDRIYNQSNNVGCWEKILLLSMVPMENMADAVRIGENVASAWEKRRGSEEKKRGVDTDHATVLAMIASTTSQKM